jgi:hypothetical protein
MKYCFIFIASFFFSLSVVKCQDLSAKRKTSIQSFITALFRDNKSQQFIIENYMHLLLKDTIDSKKKETFVRNSIDSLKKTHSVLLSSPGYEIVSYDQLKGEKRMFSEPTQNIAVVTPHGKPVLYFLFYRDKIHSFMLIQKGKYSYFLVS